MYMLLHTCAWSNLHAGGWEVPFPNVCIVSSPTKPSHLSASTLSPHKPQATPIWYFWQKARLRKLDWLKQFKLERQLRPLLEATQASVGGNSGLCWRQLRPLLSHSHLHPSRAGPFPFCICTSICVHMCMSFQCLSLSLSFSFLRFHFFLLNTRHSCMCIYIYFFFCISSRCCSQLCETLIFPISFIHASFILALRSCKRWQMPPDHLWATTPTHLEWQRLASHNYLPHTHILVKI